MEKINRIINISAAGLTATGMSFLLTGCDKPVEQPNIIYIMSDDHAAHAISAYDDRLIETPNLDRLADEGMLFTNCFCTNGICAPSRASVLTGKYSHKNGVATNRDKFDGSQFTLPKAMSKGGYKTAMIGKWHLKTEPTGFDFYKVVPGQGKYYDPEFRVIGNWDSTVTEKGYCTDVITDETIKWIKSVKDKPFFVMSHHKAPHRNWQPKKNFEDEYTDRIIPEPADLFDNYEGKSDAVKSAMMRIGDHMHDFDTGGSPPEGLSGEELTKWNYQHFMRRYLATIKSIDENIGRLYKFLEEEGLLENTIIIYTSDQGFFLGDHGWFDKRFMYEESLRMPLIIRYPAMISEGSISDEIVLNIDFMPTMIDFAGLEAPREAQGKSIRKICLGESPDNWRDAIYYHYSAYPAWHMVDKHYGIRTDRYKLFHFYGYSDEWEFFDLKEDPEEMNNLISSREHQPLITELKKKLYEEMKRYEDEKPVPKMIKKEEKGKF